LVPNLDKTLGYPLERASPNRIAIRFLKANEPITMTFIIHIRTYAKLSISP
jgi:hypothetical protein